MPTNVEIKARVGDFEAMRKKVEALADGPPERLGQEDTFFEAARGRLKLRVLSPDQGELIAYAREDAAGPRPSEYHLARTSDPASLLQVLARALAVRGVVRKERLFYRRGRTRIHLDRVEGLGAFLELEVELRSGETRGGGEAEAKDLMKRLGIRAEDLVTSAYVDLLAREG
jgi:predicted adenylyl cyclase CyaB